MQYNKIGFYGNKQSRNDYTKKSILRKTNFPQTRENGRIHKQIRETETKTKTEGRFATTHFQCRAQWP